jgi:molybdenum-dependent DNA-binding transcriptional regulator ModE
MSITKKQAWTALREIERIAQATRMERAQGRRATVAIYDDYVANTVRLAVPASRALARNGVEANASKICIEV